MSSFRSSAHFFHIFIYFLFQLNKFYWSVFDLQCCAGLLIFDRTLDIVIVMLLSGFWYLLLKIVDFFWTEN